MLVSMQPCDHRVTNQLHGVILYEPPGPSAEGGASALWGCKSAAVTERLPGYHHDQLASALTPV